MIAPAAPWRKLRDRDGGFALLEAIVAVGVLATFAVVLVHSMSGAKEATRRADNWVMARITAETLMAELFSDQTVSAGRVEGVEAGRRWTADAQPYGRLDASGRGLFRVRLAVEVSGSTTLALESLRVGAVR